MSSIAHPQFSSTVLCLGLGVQFGSIVDLFAAVLAESADELLFNWPIKTFRCCCCFLIHNYLQKLRFFGYNLSQIITVMTFTIEIHQQ